MGGRLQHGWIRSGIGHARFRSHDRRYQCQVHTRRCPASRRRSCATERVALPSERVGTGVLTAVREVVRHTPRCVPSAPVGHSLGCSGRRA
jgi:hypothetical protein